MNKANTTDTEAPFIYLHLSFAKGFVSSKIYDKRDDFDFDIVKFSFLDGDVPRRSSYGVYISQLIRFARVCNHVADFNARNKCSEAKLLQQGYRYLNLRKTFSKSYRRHYELISKFNVGLKTLLREGLSEPEFLAQLSRRLNGELIGWPCSVVRRRCRRHCRRRRSHFSKIFWSNQCQTSRGAFL